MINLRTLKYLSTEKAKDAQALFTQNRFNGAVYSMGYSIEFSLKRKISLTLGFHTGFPETNQELNAYYTKQLIDFKAIETGIRINEIKQIKNHDLNALMHYSGAEKRIKIYHNKEWELVSCWNPEKRYRRQHWGSKKAAQFILAANRILSKIN